MCSCCKNILLEAQWLDIDVAIARLGLLELAAPPQLEQTVCDHCATLVEPYENAKQ
jgi:hypothetical protein